MTATIQRAEVWGWTCPWSGDENDPAPRSYWIWYWLYRSNQQARHWLGLHEWHEVRVNADPMFYHCDWCGDRRGRLDSQPQERTKEGEA